MKLYEDDKVSAEIKGTRLHITNKRHKATEIVPKSFIPAWLLRMWAKAARDRKE